MCEGAGGEREARSEIVDFSSFLFIIKAQSIF